VLVLQVLDRLLGGALAVDKHRLRVATQGLHVVTIIITRATASHVLTSQQSKLMAETCQQLHQRLPPAGREVTMST
jgi:hypothetical protein